jgi:hypothetical protein
VSRIHFGRLEFASEISGEIMPLKCSKGDEYRNRHIKVKLKREVLKREIDYSGMWMPLQGFMH